MDEAHSDIDTDDRTWTRRRLLTVGFGGAAVVVVAGVVGIELVAHGVLPGQQRLDQLDGACSVSDQAFDFSTLGPSISGQFFSHARGRQVGYTFGYPPGYKPDDELPLVVMLHGFGGNHTDALAGISPAQAVALRVKGRPLPPMALVTIDGGGEYWNPHPGDDPMAMVIDELIPMARAMGLGRPPHKIGTMGISMGGYGALLLAEKNPHLISAVAAISPAVWTNYSEARTANPGAYASADDFANDDVVTHARSLAGIPVRVASGDSDPFHPGVEALAQVLPAGALVDFSNGCHTDPFFLEQEPLSLSFLADHLAS
jgi:pimeloyl-ACP methyl ester carboxylesterase